MFCSWQSSLWAILLEQWIMGAAHKHLQQPCPKQLRHSSPSLRPPVNTSLSQSVGACQAWPQPQSELQLSLCGFQPLLLQVVMSNPTETRRQHLQEHQSWWLSFSESKRDPNKSFLSTNEAQVKDVQYRYSSVRSKLT